MSCPVLNLSCDQTLRLPQAKVPVWKGKRQRKSLRVKGRDVRDMGMKVRMIREMKREGREIRVTGRVVKVIRKRGRRGEK